MNDHIRPIATVADILNHNKTEGAPGTPHLDPLPSEGRGKEAEPHSKGAELSRHGETELHQSGYRAARKGKIARLPKNIREQLNSRLQDGLQAKPLADWLNTLPEVNAVMAAEFEGRKVREQNISEWRKGGYKDWLTQQETMEMVERVNDDTAELQFSAQGQLGDKLATWLMARYFVAARSVTNEDGSVDWKRLRELTRDVVALRRGDVWSQRAQLEKEKFAYQQTRDGRDMEKQFWEWVAEPEICEKITKDYSGQSDRAAWAGYQMFGEFWDGPMPPGAVPLTEKQAAKVVESARARVKFTAEAAERAVAELEAVLTQVRFEPEANPESPDGNIQQPTADTGGETPNTKTQTPRNSQPANPPGAEPSNAEPGTSNSELEGGNPELSAQSDLLRPTPTNGEAPSTNLQAPEKVQAPKSKHQTAKNPPTAKPKLPPGHYSPPKPLSPDGEDL